tara:strand:- start:37 stop:834 length:798 start_codon:yes stop_codon:yes gene_type:complete
MIRINYHDHKNNTGFGNKLFLNFLARALSIKYDEPLENWLQTKIYAQQDGPYDGVVYDKWGLAWPYVNHNDTAIKIVGKETNCGYGDKYHQNRKVIELISKHKEHLIKDFSGKGCEDFFSQVFVHVRLGDLIDDNRNKDICDYEYYCLCLSNFSGGYIASDSPEHPMVKSLCNKFNLTPYRNTPEQTIIFGSKFSNKVLSLGTFSWWIGFIGNQDNVMYPNPTEYQKWHGSIFEHMENWNRISSVQQFKGLSFDQIKKINSITKY